MAVKQLRARGSLILQMHRLLATGRPSAKSRWKQVYLESPSPSTLVVKKDEWAWLKTCLAYLIHRRLRQKDMEDAQERIHMAIEVSSRASGNESNSDLSGFV